MEKVNDTDSQKTNTPEQTPADYAPTATNNSDTQQTTVRTRQDTQQSVTNKNHTTTVTPTHPTIIRGGTT
jgi:hypothetical protein